jgi:hypothetical protein
MRFVCETVRVGDEWPRFGGAIHVQVLHVQVLHVQVLHVQVIDDGGDRLSGPAPSARCWSAGPRSIDWAAVVR